MDWFRATTQKETKGEIVLHLDRLMVERKISLSDLAEKIGITVANLSKIKNNHITAMRFSTLTALCEALDCQVGDLMEYKKAEESTAGENLMNLNNLIIREIKNSEYEILNDFLYEAIFVPAGAPRPPRDIINKPDLQVYVRDFGEYEDDYAMVAEDNGEIIGACWVRIMNDYGHIDDQTPSMAIALFEAYRGHGLGARLTRALLELLREKGYRKVSLSVQKANRHAIAMYLRVGFRITSENAEEYLMVCDL